jgi:heat shock protein HslJ
MSSTNFSRCGLIIPILILVAIIASCSAGSNPGGTLEDPNLTASEWLLVSINDKPVQVDTMAVLSFDQGRQVLGSTGCNLFSGTFEVGRGSAFNVKPNMTTSFDCPEPYRAQESAMLLVLSSAANYTIEGDELRIFKTDGERKGSFVRIAPLTLEGSNWYLDAFNDGQGAFIKLIEGSQITTSFNSEGKMKGSGGCNDYHATYQVDGNKITIGPIISTKMTCSDPDGVTEQEDKYFQAMDLVETFRNFSIALNFYNAEGQILARYYSSDLERNP